MCDAPRENESIFPSCRSSEQTSRRKRTKKDENKWKSKVTLDETCKEVRSIRWPCGGDGSSAASTHNAVNKPIWWVTYFTGSLPVTPSSVLCVPGSVAIACNTIHGCVKMRWTYFVCIPLAQFSCRLSPSPMETRLTNETATIVLFLLRSVQCKLNAFPSTFENQN